MQARLWRNIPQMGDLMKHIQISQMKKHAIFGLVSCLALLSASCIRDRGSTFKTLDVIEAEDGVFAIDLMVLQDNSGSITDSDPENLRMEATSQMIEKIARENTLSEISRIGILCFSDDAHVMAPLGQPSIAKDAVSSMKTSASGNTNLLAALRMAYQTFADSDTFPHRKPVVFLLTDGSPYDDRNFREVGAYFLELQAFIEEKLRSRGCAIYVLGINARKGWDQVEEYWQRICDGVYEVDDEEQLEPALRNIIEQIYGIPPVAREVVTPEKELLFAVPPYTEKLEIYVLSQRDNGHLEVHNPDGNAMVEGESGILTEVFGSYRGLSVLEPTQGQWLLATTDGEFSAYRRAIPYRLRLARPESLHPVGKTLEFEVAFLKSDGKPVPELLDHKLRFSGQIVAPDGSMYKLEIEEDISGIYTARSALIPDVEGMYKVALIAQGGASFCSRNAETITVKLMPYVDITNPTDSKLSFGDLEIVVGLLQAGEQLPAQEVETSSLLARLEKPSGEIVTTWLEMEPESDDAVLSGSFPHGLNQEGQYNLHVKQVDSAASGDTIIFSVRRSYLSQLRQWVIYAGIGLISLFFLAILTFLIRARGLPRIMGSVSEYLSSDQDIFLRQRQIYRKRWTLMHLRRYSDIPGRLLLATGAPGGDGAIDIWYRAGLKVAKWRLYKDSVFELEKRRLEYI